MIAELSHFALILALVAALAQAASPWLHEKLAPRAAGLFFVLMTAAFGGLLWLFAVCDFSVTTVAANGHTLLPLHYRIAAAWGNHEGSMLMWVWLLALWGALLAPRGKALGAQFLAKALAAQGALGAGFTAFVLFASNPFARINPAPFDGAGLNPLLQDPALAVHPPLLYTGYVGFSAVFCLAVAALWERRVNADFARMARPYALLAWAFLTAGIAMGSLWAYYELGWGGFWFWDPVENASLMPWLIGTALVHALLVLQKRDTLRGWVAFLAILAFTFSLLGTFLVRSGLLSSVHAFASDPTRGVFILGLLALSIGGAFALFALRLPERGPKAPFGLFSYETMMLLNNVFLFAVCAAVFMGTLYPVFLQALGLETVTVGAPYYAAILVPLLAPFAMFMGLAPHAGWKKGAVGGAVLRIVPALALAVVPVILPYYSGVAAPKLMMYGYGLAGWIFAATVFSVFRRTAPKTAAWAGMIVAHIGFAVFIAGVTGATQAVEEKIAWMQPGDRMQIGGRVIAMLGEEGGIGSTYNYRRALFVVRGVDRKDQDGNVMPSALPEVFMAPEKRWYPVAARETAEAALRNVGPGILYLSLGERTRADKVGAGWRYVVRAWYHPMITFVFGGGGLMALGGLIAMLGRRKKETEDAV